MASRLNTTTNTKLLPKLVDTVLRGNVLATRALTAAQKWSSERIRKAVKLFKNDQGSSFSGFDNLSTTAVDTRRYMEFTAKFYQIPVVLPITELAINEADENRRIMLAAEEMASTAEDMADDLGTQFYADGTGNGGKNFLGLAAIVDDGTNAPTYGGLSRTTYATLRSTVTASSGSITLAKMATLYNAISDGAVKPTLGLSDPTVFSLYESLLNSLIRINMTVPEVRAMKQGLAGTAGFTGLDYKGFPILADRKATAQTLFFVNEDFLEFRAIEKIPESEPVNFQITDIEGNDYTNVKGLGFAWTGWVKPSDQMALVGRIVLGGEFWSSNPLRHGKLTGITSAA